jgi:hypothetical protein
MAAALGVGWALLLRAARPSVYAAIAANTTAPPLATPDPFWRSVEL